MMILFPLRWKKQKRENMSELLKTDLNQISTPETLLYHTLTAVSSIKDVKQKNDLIETLSFKALEEPEFCSLLTNSISVYFHRIFTGQYFDNIDYVNFFIDLIEETGLSDLEEEVYKYIQFNFPLLAIQDHPQKHYLIDAIKLFSKIQTKNPKYELFWKNLWEEGNAEIAPLS